VAAKELVAELVAKDRYNPAILPQLEKYVEEQIQSGSYDLDVNLAVLKLYQFHPEKTNLKVVGQILAKALTNLPHADFSLCLYLLSERVQEEKEVATLKELHGLLETASFAEFWTRLEADNDTTRTLKTLPGFVAAVQSWILDVLALTYQTIPRQALGELLRLPESSLDGFLASHDKKAKSEGDHVVFPITGFNQAKQKKIKEHIDAKKMASVRALLHN